MRTQVEMVAAMGLLAVFGLAGCASGRPGTTRSLGEVSYPAAWRNGREVFSQYFSLAEADPETGVLTSRPRSTEPAPDRILGSPRPTRQRALMQLRREDGHVVARVQVTVEKMSSTAHRAMNPQARSYDTVANQTPAELEAATTTEQNESWVTEGYDHALERAILDELYRRLNPRRLPGPEGESLDNDQAE